jgi:hypothetical protein
VNEINNLKRDWKKIKVFFKKFLMTKWNRHAGQVFREILTQAAQGDLTPTSDNLEELLETYKVNVTEFSLVNEKPK